MYSFRNDYSEGAHPKVLQRLVDTNLTQTCGYALDPLSDAARETVRRVCQAPEAEVQFLSGGTQTNLLTIAAFLRPYEAVIAPATAHISLHEAGAIEATGHKVLAVETPDGKLTPAMVEAVLEAHPDEFMVRPKMVYVADTTELGTIYTKAELTALRRCCDQHGLYLGLDGARLGSALTAQGNDLTLPDLAALTDAFYIGGTKNGALLGEALVLKHPMDHFRWHMKQRGATLAKGRVIALQFQALLEDGLYFELARHANDMAIRLCRGMAALGYGFPIPSPSNQQFPVLPNTVARRLEEMGYQFEPERVIDADHTCVRFVTSWATPQSAVDEFLRDLAECE